ncbi:putative membrane protein [Angulomicrobium tetraedrale]|uniref:Putative membrane protein n=1 Tax=Ancylobacter tetraedralis TaxID=217068 RepID=A0A839ZDV4_9HYPH|nr:TIGR01620 family protein [Ancylobacter tetraedralis]MBB3772846.1 putative membrane protein [Ancylobacter tetraedralis]
MTDRTSRRPQAFRLDDPGVVLAEEGRAAPRGAIVVTPAPAIPEAAEDVPLPTPPPRSSVWGKLFWGGLGGLVSLGLGLAVSKLIEDLFTRADWLGYTGLAFAAALAVATLAILGRELFGLLRLNTLNRVREKAALAILKDDRALAAAVTQELLALTKSSPRLFRARTELGAHLDAIIDGADLVRLTERQLMAPLDAEATRLVSGAAKRVSVVTAVSPRAAVDLIFVLITAIGLVRRLAELYGGRPGALGMLRLFRQVLAHLAVTGGMAAGDSLIQQVVGHGLAAKLSARLGEGVVNGLLTARLGLAAIEVTRPLPFAALPAPALRDVASGLISRGEEEEPKTPLKQPTMPGT